MRATRPARGATPPASALPARGASPRQPRRSRARAKSPRRRSCPPRPTSRPAPARSSRRLRHGGRPGRYNRVQRLGRANPPPYASDDFRRALDLVRGRAPSEAEPQRAARFVAARPIASSTCEGSTAPAAHADPIETSTPSRSSAISMLSPSTPGKVRLSVLPILDSASSHGRRH